MTKHERLTELTTKADALRAEAKKLRADGDRKAAWPLEDAARAADREMAGILAGVDWDELQKLFRQAYNG